LPAVPSVIIEFGRVTLFLRVKGLVFLLVVAVGCTHSVAPPAAPSVKVKLVTLPTESDSFPAIAKAMTPMLAQAKVRGVDEEVASKVSIEVVQLSIECVDPTSSCYDAAAKSLRANKLLFAQIDIDGKKPKVAVTLFDASTDTPHTTERVFDTEAAALAGLDKLVAEATR
jgi:hypothetical protein